MKKKRGKMRKNVLKKHKMYYIEQSALPRFVVGSYSLAPTFSRQ
jgi:hypothetical protein